MAAPFRIGKPLLRGLGDPPDQQFKEYLGRLLKMIPAEIIGVYMIGAGFIPATERVASAIWVGLCFVFVFIIRIYGTADPEEGLGPQPIPVFVAAIAFLIWVYSQGGPFEQFGLYVPYVGSLAVLVWTFLIPIIYKGR